MIFRSTIVAAHVNFVACEVLSQLQRVMENPRFLLAGECVPLRAGETDPCLRQPRALRMHLSHDTIALCKWTHQKVLSK
jgi:hypothetical protein